MMERSQRSSWRSISIAVGLALVTSVFPFLPASAEPGSVTAFTIDSEQGDWVGAGQSLTFTPSNASVSPLETFGGGVSLRATNPDHFFHARIHPPTGQTLEPGTYDTTRFASETTAGLDVAGDGRGCNDTVGTVSPRRLVRYGWHPRDVRCFVPPVPREQRVGTGLFGELRFASSVDFAAAEAAPSFLDLGQVGLTTQASVPIDVANTGTLSLDLGDVSIGGTGASAYAVIADGCSGTTLIAGAVCTVEVGFSPTDLGMHEVTVILPDTTPRGGRSILLRGEGRRFGTTVTLAASSLKVAYGKTVRLTAHLNQFESSLSHDLTIFATPYGGTKQAIASDRWTRRET